MASHLVNEVEQICDSVAILSKGRIIAHGAVEELIGREDRHRLHTTNNSRAEEILGGLDWVASVGVERGALNVAAPSERSGELTATTRR